MNLTKIARRNEQRRREQRRRRVLLLGLAGVVLVAAAVVLWPRPAYVPEVAGRPNLVIDQTYVDFGVRKWNEPVTAIFRLRNTGDQVLRILNVPQVRVVTGCCPPPVQLGASALQPGQEVTLSVTFTMHEGMDGPHDFRVMVETNDPAHTQQELTILSNWVQ